MEHHKSSWFFGKDRINKQIAFIYPVVLFVLTATHLLFFSEVYGQNFIPEHTIEEVNLELRKQFGEPEAERIANGTKMVASLWRESDGTVEDFKNQTSEN